MSALVVFSLVMVAGLSLILAGFIGYLVGLREARKSYLPVIRWQDKEISHLSLRLLITEIGASRTTQPQDGGDDGRGVPRSGLTTNLLPIRPESVATAPRP